MKIGDRVATDADVELAEEIWREIYMGREPQTQRIAHAIASIRSAERERCAKIAERHLETVYAESIYDRELLRGCCKNIAGQIRIGK
jgi:hypothetical protein